MLLRHLVKSSAAAALIAAMIASPAQAHGDAKPGMPIPDQRPVWKEGMPPMPPMAAPMQTPVQAQGLDPRAREEWLNECRSRYASNDRGLGGALIGGVVGGLLGNRIGGKGNRTVGTVAGAAVGAVTGTVIDKAEDRGKARDYCESYLDDYYARATQAGYGYPGPGHHGHGAPAYGYAPAYYGYAVPMMMVPAPMQGHPHCKEVVTYEYVTVPARRRHIPRAVPDKRIRLAPDKRIPTK